MQSLGCDVAALNTVQFSQSHHLLPLSIPRVRTYTHTKTACRQKETGPNLLSSFARK